MAGCEKGPWAWNWRKKIVEIAEDVEVTRWWNKMEKCAVGKAWLKGLTTRGFSEKTALRSGMPSGLGCSSGIWGRGDRWSRGHVKTKILFQSKIYNFSYPISDSTRFNLSNSQPGISIVLSESASLPSGSPVISWRNKASRHLKARYNITMTGYQNMVFAVLAGDPYFHMLCYILLLNEIFTPHFRPKCLKTTTISLYKGAPPVPGKRRKQKVESISRYLNKIANKNTSSNFIFLSFTAENTLTQAICVAFISFFFFEFTFISHRQWPLRPKILQ